MTIALLILSALQIIIHAIEITIPHRIQELIYNLKENPETFELDRFSMFYSMLPAIHIPFVILLFLSDVDRFFYYGLYFTISFFLEGPLIEKILKHRELITLLAIINLVISIDIFRSSFF